MVQQQYNTGTTDWYNRLVQQFKNNSNMKKIYPYVNMTRANADGSYSVFLIVKGAKGRFFVNTGLSTCDKLVERSFPKSDANWKRKTTLLGKYLADAEAVCINADIADLTDAELKQKIQAEVFGVEQKQPTSVLSNIILQFAETKKDATKSIYALTARKVAEFDRNASLEADTDWLDRFRTHLMDGGMGINGVAKDLRNIRAVFNWARRKGMTQNYPFFDFKIVNEETVPNNISAEDLRKLHDYPCESWQKPYVDFFFLSFFLAGINPVDLLSLRKENYKDGHITFVRQKTNKEGAHTIRTVTLPVLPEAKEIIDRYPSEEGWLLGFMDCRNDYRSFARGCNDALCKVGPTKKVKDKVGKLRKMEYNPICPDITLYSARYSFGSIAANDLDISERTIGMCLGHSWSKNVTCRYMAHDQSKVDAVVKRVVEYVVGGANL